jgi:hypothetical protein
MTHKNDPTSAAGRMFATKDPMARNLQYNHQNIKKGGIYPRQSKDPMARNLQYNCPGIKTKVVGHIQGNVRKTICTSEAVLWIRICRIRMFLGLLDPDPDPFVRGSDPDPSLFS